MTYIPPRDNHVHLLIRNAPGSLPDRVWGPACGWEEGESVVGLEAWQMDDATTTITCPQCLEILSQRRANAFVLTAMALVLGLLLIFIMYGVRNAG
jgi:predicted nucleic acid-binding Zn ribbon protein